ncbi:hypothetical protein NQZ79_g1190 [Umbelopsis isabellina]|nr:hypothetical protein NQZ79_g1190 [Umbelopsis isabellina]
MVQECRAATPEEDNPFLATSDGETRKTESVTNDSVTEEDCEFNDDDDDDDDDDENIHTLGIRKLSEIRFPEYVDGLEDPRIKFTREDTFRSVLERKNGKTSDDPPRTPQRQNDTRSDKMLYDDDSPCRPDRTPQKTVKRLRREEDYVTPNKPIVLGSSPTKAPKCGPKPSMIPNLWRSSTTPTKVRRSPRTAQSYDIYHIDQENKSTSRKASPFHFSKLSRLADVATISSSAKVKK